MAKILIFIAIYLSFLFIILRIMHSGKKYDEMIEIEFQKRMKGKSHAKEINR